MLSILINNESEKKGYKKSQQIISKYLPQFGQRTFSGSISKEGLDNLYEELKSASSRYISISCILIKDKHTSYPLWFVGNKKNFDEETGIYAMKYRNKNIVSCFKPIISDIENIYLSIIRVSSLFHDIGKSNNDFQNKLRKIVRNQKIKEKITGPDLAEYFRHETVSAILLNMYIKKYGFNFSDDTIEEKFSDIANDIESMVSNSSFDTIYNYFLNELTLILNKIKKLQIFVSEQKQNRHSALFKKIEPHNLNYENLIEYSILWLVLTHHRMIGLKHNSNDNTINPKDLFNLDPSNNSFINIIFDLKDETKIRSNFSFSYSAPYQNKNWLAGVKNEFEKLLKVDDNIKKEILKDSNKKSFLSALVHYARPQLVFSDYLSSVVKNKVDKNLKISLNEENKRSVANLEKNDFGDSLDSHLLSVSRSARNLFFLVNKSEDYNNHAFNIIEHHETKKLNKEIDTVQDSKFDWQNKSYQAISETVKKENNFNFCVVISETGSGKTIGGAKIMKAIQSGNMRYTLCLGLRTLTLQTGQVYREELGLNQKKVAVIIGNSLSKKIYEENQNKTGSGSDALDNDDFNYNVDYKTETFLWNEQLKNKSDLNQVKLMFEKNTNKLIDAPITICTIDQIINITNFNKISNVKILPRIFSSDLLLDEIDNYSPEDIVAVGKLIYLHGIYGRNVTIMSATVSKNIVIELYKAYAEGIKVNNFIKQKNKKINSFFISNLTLIESNILDHNELISEKFDLFANLFVKKQQEKHAKIKTSFPRNFRYDFWENDVYEMCYEMHNKWKIPVKIKDNIFNISIGFTRFNTVKSARTFAKFVFTEDEEMLKISDSFKVGCLCYHSKYSIVEIDNIETQLSEIINRKNINNLERSKIIKNFILNNFKEIADNHEKEIMIIVSSTSILEVGRDHDYDWAIIEPSTNKSIVQTVGRVLRHRENVIPEERVIILNNPLKKNLQEASTTWKNIGVFNYINKIEEHENKVSFDTMFDVNDFIDGISSGLIFKDNNKNIMKYLEYISYEKYLIKSKYSLMKYILEGDWLNNYHYCYQKFRNSNDGRVLGYISFINEIYRKESYISDCFYFSNSQDKIPKKEIKNERINYFKERVLIDIPNIKKMLFKYSSFSNSELNSLIKYDIKYYNSGDILIENKIKYHKILGFDS